MATNCKVWLNSDNQLIVDSDGMIRFSTDCPCVGGNGLLLAGVGSVPDFYVTVTFPKNVPIEVPAVVSGGWYLSDIDDVTAETDAERQDLVKTIKYKYTAINTDDYAGPINVPHDYLLVLKLPSAIAADIFGGGIYNRINALTPPLNPTDIKTCVDEYLEEVQGDN